MLVKQLKERLAAVDDSVELSVLVGFDVLNVEGIYDQQALLDYLVRTVQQMTHLPSLEQRRAYYKAQGKCLEWLENPLWAGTVFLVAVASDTTIQERP